MRQKRFSIRSEIVLNITILVLISILLLSYLLLEQMKASLIDSERAHHLENLSKIGSLNSVGEVAAALSAYSDFAIWAPSGALSIHRGEASKSIALSNTAVRSQTALVQEKVIERRVFFWVKKIDAIYFQVPVGNIAFVVAKMPFNRIDAQVRDAKRAILVFTLIYSALLALFAYFVLSKVVVAPLKSMIRAAKKISNGEFSQRLPVQRQDEVSQLAITINSMTEKLVESRGVLEQHVDELQSLNEELKKMELENVRKEKLASVGQLAAGLAHEIGNPLGAMMGYVDILKGSPDAQTRDNLLERTERELQRIHKIIRELLGYARPERLDVKRFEGAELVKEVMHELVDPKFLKGVEIREEFTDNSFVRMDPDQLKQVLLNLIINACHAMHDSAARRLIVRTKVSVLDDAQGTVVIEVEDSGMGIGSDNLKQIFDPFYTTKDPGEGTGLGLYISSRIIEAWGGSVKVSSTEGAGSIFSILLPQA